MRVLVSVVLLLLVSMGWAQVRINEIQSSNSSTLPDNYGQYEDWVEIYNPTDKPVDIGGLVLKDQVDTWRIPTGDTSTVLAPGGFFLLWADDEEEQGKFHTNFKLSAANGEFLGLFQSDSMTIIDTVYFPPLSNDQSYGRCDLTGWQKFNKATPLSKNDCANASQQIPDKKNLKIYPSVTERYVHIDIAGQSKDPIRIHLYSPEGKLLIDKIFDNNQITLDFDELKPGTYLIGVSQGQTSYTEKIIRTMP